MGDGLLEIAAPKFAEFVSGRKKIKAAAIFTRLLSQSVLRQTLRKQLSNGSRKRMGAISGKEFAQIRQASRFIPTNPAK